MSTPVSVDIPHKLGREEARRRIGAGLAKLPAYLPKGAVVTPRRAGDRLDVDVTVGATTVACKLDVGEHQVHVDFVLPGMFGLLAGPITAALRDHGDKLLGDGRK